MAVKAKKLPYAKLRGLRAERGLSQPDMAKILGMSVGSYLAKETGKIDWKSSEMAILMKYFKMGSDDLFFNN